MASKKVSSMVCTTRVHLLLLLRSQFLGDKTKVQTRVMMFSIIEIKNDAKFLPHFSSRVLLSSLPERIVAEAMDEIGTVRS